MIDAESKKGSEECQHYLLSFHTSGSSRIAIGSARLMLACSSGYMLLNPRLTSAAALPMTLERGYNFACQEGVRRR
jgi:hypothetical protein